MSLYFERLIQWCFDESFNVIVNDSYHAFFISKYCTEQLSIEGERKNCTTTLIDGNLPLILTIADGSFKPCAEIELAFLHIDHSIKLKSDHYILTLIAQLNGFKIKLTVHNSLSRPISIYYWVLWKLNGTNCLYHVIYFWIFVRWPSPIHSCWCICHL